MSDIYSILSSNYVTVGSSTNYSKTPYKAVDPADYQGKWDGTYSDNTKFSITVSNVNGYHAKVKYQSGSTVKYQDVLIRDSSFRIGDSKFALIGGGKALVATVVTSPVDGSSRLEKAYAAQAS